MIGMRTFSVAWVGAMVRRGGVHPGHADIPRRRQAINATSALALDHRYCVANSVPIPLPLGRVVAGFLQKKWKSLSLILLKKMLDWKTFNQVVLGSSPSRLTT